MTSSYLKSHASFIIINHILFMRERLLHLIIIPSMPGYSISLSEMTCIIKQTMTNHNNGVYPPFVLCMLFYFVELPGRIAQTAAHLTEWSEVPDLIPVLAYSFVETDPEIFSMTFSCPHPLIPLPNPLFTTEIKQQLNNNKNLS